MISFDRLVLSGFKSFVDKTELEITSGLTGIVGPNGCGKSNLVEALRWAMGESSAKRMRGGDMDDVIFNGTSSRPARNFAEVTIMLNNGMHTAPEPYTAFDQIEISRRIEREQGSTYRVNGKIARARDVQLLFADTMTGANSPALVSQGKLTQIISAKPFDRRMILEESAGITGLHARRHEAELRLQAADNNLIRLQDVVGNLETQLNALKRQSRQAEKYRVISDEIKQLETDIAALEWVKLVRQQQVSQHEATTAESTVADTLLTVTQLTKTQETQSLDLPRLRTAAAEASARYQAVAIEIRQLDSEEAQVRAAIAEAREQLAQIAADMTHDQQLIDDGQALLSTLDAEQKQLISEMEQQDGRLPDLEATRDAIAARLDSEEKELQAKVQVLIETQTKRNSLTQQVNNEDGRLSTARARKNTTAQQLMELEQRNNFAGDDDAQAEIAKLEATLADMQAAAPKKQENVGVADVALTSARQVLQTVRDALTKLKVEKDTLENFLAADLSSSTHPVLDDIKADTGFEQALAQALGDTLFGSTDEQASVVWRAHTGVSRNTTALPAGVSPIADKVKAPSALQYALAYIGYVADKAAGDAVAAQLQPGQTLVSLDGYLWRWDGLFIKPSAKDKQALILEQKNRLGELSAQLPVLTAQLGAAELEFANAEAALTTARSSARTHDEEQRVTQVKLNTARQSFQQKMHAQQQMAADRARLTETLALLNQDIAEREANVAAYRAELATLEDPANVGLDRDVANLREKVSVSQGELRDASLSVDRYLQEDARRKARLHGIADQRIALNNRTVRAAEHMDQLRTREAQNKEKLDGLSGKPAAIVETRNNLMSRTSELEVEKTAAENALQVVENEVSETTRALKQAEAELSNAKESRAGIHARLTALVERMAALEVEITAQFDQSPAQLMEAAKISFGDNAVDLPDVDAKRARKDKLVRDREAIGPVNLRADVEAQEIDTGLAKILAERDDLMAAIDELRGGIAKINVEAKERLVTAFDTINTHFKELFTKLFGGGQAYLQLIQTDDPLGAGLEIYAQPPGKTLQSISLLSGGEQSLTAAALIFAMFLTNPSPICVLDEIDAPLDDANVDRICDLLRHITDISKTRFLVVTHHRLTMARMDRLYGVTMGEKGVSQLVSVDLNRQMDMLEAAE